MVELPDYKKKSLSDVVVTHIKNCVLSGSIKAGDRLIEADISSDLSVSRAPVREALRILNEQGVVTFSPRRGNQVQVLTLDEVMEIFEIRASLEIDILGALVTKNLLQETDYRELGKLTDQMRNGEKQCYAERDRIYLLNMLDISFHRYLWAAAKSPRRAQILEGLFYQLLIVMNTNTHSLGSFEEKADEHQRILCALRTKQLPQILASFERHLQSCASTAFPGKPLPRFSGYPQSRLYC